MKTLFCRQKIWVYWTQISRECCPIGSILPPTVFPKKNFMMFNPMQAFANFKEADVEDPVKFGESVSCDTDYSRWCCLYTQYIDSSKKTSQGRRLAKPLCVDKPTLDEMGEICAYFKLPYVLEYTKKYPRMWLEPGRIRVLFRHDETGEIINDEIPSKAILMKKMGEYIPKLKSRCMPKISTGKSGGCSTSSYKQGKKKK